MLKDLDLVHGLYCDRLTVSLVELSPARIRSWRSLLLNRGVGEVTAAKAYRLLRTILATAVEDRLIRTNHVRATLTEMSDGQLIVGPPKTAAGRRMVALPPACSTSCASISTPS